MYHHYCHHQYQYKPFHSRSICNCTSTIDDQYLPLNILTQNSTTISINSLMHSVTEHHITSSFHHSCPPPPHHSFQLQYKHLLENAPQVSTWTHSSVFLSLYNFVCNRQILSNQPHSPSSCGITNINFSPLPQPASSLPWRPRIWSDVRGSTSSSHKVCNTHLNT